jgi:hypothetical protein
MSKPITPTFILRQTRMRLAKIRRNLTASNRGLPDFIIIGAQKAGTTSLFKYLRQHPNIIPAFKKEVKFFDCNYYKGLNWYRSHFPIPIEMGEEQFSGEASPHYIFHPLAPTRIAETMPNIKLIALLRNPVDRAFSHYQLNVRRRREKLSFEEAIQREEERLAGMMESILASEPVRLYNFLHYSYLSKGIYIDQLRNWFEHFPREQVLILKSEDFFNDPAGVFQTVLEFLKYPHWALKSYVKYNSGNYTGLQPETRLRLQEYFKPHNQKLYEYLGFDFGWEKV